MTWLSASNLTSMMMDSNPSPACHYGLVLFLNPPALLGYTTYTMTSSLTDTRTPFDRFYTCRDQPWRFLYTAYQIGSTLLFRLPFWLFIGLFPWGRLHPQFTTKKAIIIRLTKIILQTAIKYVNAHIITQLRFLGIRSRLQNRKVR